MTELPKLKTEDYGTQAIKASSLDGEGMDFVYTGIESGENKFGNIFYVISGRETEAEDSKLVEVIFNSEKLAKLFKDNEAVLKGKMINLAGRGEGVARQYDVRVTGIQTKVDEDKATW